MNIQLTEVDEFELIPHPSVNFRLSFWKPSHFPTRLEIHSEKTTWRTFVIDAMPCGVRVENRGATWHCTVFSVKEQWSCEKLPTLIARMRNAYGLDDDYADFIQICQRDTRLSRIIGPFAGMRSSCPENLFELSVLTVLLQNTTMKRSRDMLDAVLRLAGETVEYDGVQLLCFCTPESLLKLGTEHLRNEAKVGYRDKVLISIAEFFTGKPMEYRGQAPDELLTLLCQIKGVGPYTAGIVAASVFHDQSAYGLDVWNKKIIKEALSLAMDMPDSELKKYLTAHFAPCEGLVVEILVENHFLRNPVCRAYPTDALARAASWCWPR
jgi:3-methyladenine DNA glycosylase/8-oxoguanine DNA glycosylase